MREATICRPPGAEIAGHAAKPADRGWHRQVQLRARSALRVRSTAARPHTGLPRCDAPSLQSATEWLFSCEHVFVTSQGSAHARFRRALATGNPLLVRAAAAELGSISLADALSICLCSCAPSRVATGEQQCAFTPDSRRRSLVWSSRTHRSCWRPFRACAGLTPLARALRWPSSLPPSSLPTYNTAPGGLVARVATLLTASQPPEVGLLRWPRGSDAAVRRATWPARTESRRRLELIGSRPQVPLPALRRGVAHRGEDVRRRPKPAPHAPFGPWSSSPA
jgi:hypothetical protein